MTIPSLIIKEIATRKVGKLAVRAAQRKIGVNKAMSLVRRFDKRKTFMINLKNKPVKMVEKLFKQYLKRKALGLLPPVRYINNWRKYGLKEAMKRIVLKTTPTELKQPYYFIKNIKDQYEKIQVIALGKKTFWEEINKMEQKQQAKVLNAVIKFHPRDRELKAYWEEVLNKEFQFIANSPMTGNFAQLPCVYNVSKMYLYLPIRGFAGKQVKTYKFENILWEQVFPAMKGADFGKRIYAQFRSANADRYAIYWAPLDPNYPKSLSSYKKK